MAEYERLFKTVVINDNTVTHERRMKHFDQFNLIAGGRIDTRRGGEQETRRKEERRRRTKEETKACYLLCVCVLCAVCCVCVLTMAV